MGQAPEASLQGARRRGNLEGGIRPPYYAHDDYNHPRLCEEQSDAAIYAELDCRAALAETNFLYHVFARSKATRQSTPRKTLIAYALCLFLSACGFTPMLAKNDGEASQSGARLVVVNATRDGSSYAVQMLRQRLKMALSDLNLDASYKIHIALREETGSLAYATDATATRSMLRMTARIIISHNSQTVFEKAINGVTTYSQNTNDEFVNQSAAQGAQERLIESISVDISRELGGFARSMRAE